MDELEAERRRLNAMNRSLQDPGTPGTRKTDWAMGEIHQFLGQSWVKLWEFLGNTEVLDTGIMG